MKRFLFIILAMTMIAFLMEVFSWSAYYFSTGEFFSFSAIDAQRESILSKESSDSSDLQSSEDQGDVVRYGNDNFSYYEVIHPFLGFVRDPTRTAFHSKLGFYSKDIPSGFPPPDVVRIGVFGGSFAEQLADYGYSQFAQEINAMPIFQNKRVEMYSFAMGGYKQPQQLMTLAYLLSLSIRFSIIINIDGFNEVALPVAENLPKGVFPFYPRGWYLRGQGFDSDVLHFIGQKAYAQRHRVEWAEFWKQSFLRYSVTGNLVWKLYDNRLHWEQIHADLAYQRYEINLDSEHAYRVTGPEFKYENDEELYKALALNWAESSLQMYFLAVDNGADYFHFLQPNQYFENSKQLSEQEKQMAFRPDHPYRPGPRYGYPHLQIQGEDLRRLNVNFYDLTMAFSDVETTVYCDDCCHLTPAGQDIIRKNIIARMIEYYESKKKEPN